MTTDHTDRIVPRKVGRPRKEPIKPVKKAITVRVSIDLLERMNALQRSAGISKTFMVEAGVSAFLSHRGQPKKTMSELRELEEAAEPAAKERERADG
jgi:hypothetical protein